MYICMHARHIQGSPGGIRDSYSCVGHMQRTVSAEVCNISDSARPVCGPLVNVECGGENGDSYL